MGSRPVRPARDTVGTPTEPKQVGTPLATRQTRTACSGGKPRAASMPAGMATAVPKPLMPSMKPPKHQATSSASTRRSRESEVIMEPITSMAPVRTHRLYVNTAAMMTRTIGHSAMTKPSMLAVATSMAGMPHQVSANPQAITKDPMAAFHAGRCSAMSATTNQIMGNNANTNGTARAAIDTATPNDLRCTMSDLTGGGNAARRSRRLPPSPLTLKHRTIQQARH